LSVVSSAESKSTESLGSLAYGATYQLL